jgi:hypothetical protein
MALQALHPLRTNGLDLLSEILAIRRRVYECPRSVSSSISPRPSSERLHQSLHRHPSSTHSLTYPAALLNVLENTLNMIYVYLTLLSSSPTRLAAAPVIGLIGASMTASKTFLYWAQDYYCGWCSSGHNTWTDIFVLIVLSNG